MSALGRSCRLTAAISGALRGMRRGEEEIDEATAVLVRDYADHEQAVVGDHR